jgi:hypothetical protein
MQAVPYFVMKPPTRVHPCQNYGNKPSRDGRRLAKSTVVVIFLAWSLYARLGLQMGKLVSMWSMRTENAQLALPEGQVVSITTNKTWPHETMEVRQDSPNLTIATNKTWSPDTMEGFAKPNNHRQQDLAPRHNGGKAGFAKPNDRH